MPSSRMLRREDLVRIDVSEECSISIIRVTVNVVPSSPIVVTLMMEGLCFSGVTSQKTAFFIVIAVKTQH
jgi:hypothetical protein